MPRAALVATLLLVPVTLIRAQDAVRVGVYENPPLISTSSAGAPEGFVVDILSSIARREGWTLEFVPCLWPDCLSRLEDGRIDLLGAIAWSAERAGRFDLSAETVVVNWGLVYARHGLRVESVADLASRTIVLLDGDIYGLALVRMLERMEIPA